MSTKLSHSQISRYQQCGKSYYYHYIAKIRPSIQSAALCFGTALDNALNELLVPTNKTPEQVFLESFKCQTVNNKLVELPTNTDLVYAETDYDAELLTEEDKDAMDLYFKGENGFAIYEELRKLKKEKGFENLSIKQKQDYNFMNWLSLKNKGLLMLKAYRKKVLPKILKVHEVQRYVSLENGIGDKIIGYVDLVADIEGHGTCILDHKTSAREYEEDSVLSSPQLSLYMHILEGEYKTRKAGYIVLRKQVIKNRKKTCSVCGHDGTGGRHTTCNAIVSGKRCGGEWHEEIDPDIGIQFIVDEIPHMTEEIVITNYDEVNKAIKAELFHRNFNSCDNVYGAPCPYRNLCFKGSKKGLTEF